MDFLKDMTLIGRLIVLLGGIVVFQNPQLFSSNVSKINSFNTAKDAIDLPNLTGCVFVPFYCLFATISCNIKVHYLKSTKLQRCTECLSCRFDLCSVTTLYILQTFSNALLEIEAKGIS